jgi:hypothetical protein
MSYTYEWLSEEKLSLKRVDGEGKVSSIPADPGNRDYDEFLSSGATAEEYVAPEPPAPPTPAEKLAAAGLTVDELKELLGL